MTRGMPLRSRPASRMLTFLLALSLSESWSAAVFSASEVTALADHLNARIAACVGPKRALGKEAAQFNFNLPDPTEEVAGAVDCAMRESKSQHLEELLLLPSLLHAAQGQPGTFVELGALDGVRYSNTYILEKCFNWTGVLIEANPVSYQRLLKSGRRSTMIHSGACEGNGTITMAMAADGHGLGDLVGGAMVAAQLTADQFAKDASMCANGIRNGSICCSASCGRCDAVRTRACSCRPGGRENCCAGQIRRRAMCSQPSDVGCSMASRAQTIQVPCSPLSELMARAGLAAGASLLSLDVEGAEETVLKTVDPGRFGVVLVEADGKDGPKDRRVKKAILGAGMREAQSVRVTMSGVYLHPQRVPREIAVNRKAARLAGAGRAIVTCHSGGRRALAQIRTRAAVLQRAAAAATAHRAAAPATTPMAIAPLVPAAAATTTPAAVVTPAAAMPPSAVAAAATPAAVTSAAATEAVAAAAVATAREAAAREVALSAQAAEKRRRKREERATAAKARCDALLRSNGE